MSSVGPLRSSATPVGSMIGRSSLIEDAVKLNPNDARDLEPPGLDRTDVR